MYHHIRNDLNPDKQSDYQRKTPPMRKFFAILITFTFLQSCDDGDIIATNFDFDNVSLKTCGNIGNYVFYKENTQSFESLSLRLGVAENLYATAETKTYALDATTNFVNYRRYDGALSNNYFCSSVPPSSPKIMEDYKASSGYVTVIVSFDYDNEIPEQTTIRKDVQVILKDIVLVKEGEQIIIETLNMGTIEGVEVEVITP